jgi:hypothetical protein
MIVIHVNKSDVDIVGLHLAAAFVATVLGFSDDQMRGADIVVIDDSDVEGGAA